MATHKNMTLGRRGFLSKSALLGAGMAAAPLAFAIDNSASNEHPPKNPTAKAGNRMLGGLEVSPIGLGCMSMKSGSYNPPRDKKDMIPVIRGAYDLGVTFFDTA